MQSNTLGLDSHRSDRSFSDRAKKPADSRPRVSKSANFLCTVLLACENIVPVGGQRVSRVGGDGYILYWPRPTFFTAGSSGSALLTAFVRFFAPDL